MPQKWFPGSDDEARSVLGLVLSPERLAELREKGVSCELGEWQRGSKSWRCALDLGLPAGVEPRVIDTPSPGMPLFASEPTGEPPIAATPAAWYERHAGKPSIFSGLEATIQSYASLSYFAREPGVVDWWKQFLDDHRPADDGSMRATPTPEQARFIWPAPAASRPNRVPPPPPPPPSTRPDWVQYYGYRAGDRRRANERAADEAPREAGAGRAAIAVEVNQLVVVKYKIEGESESDPKHLALARVLRTNVLQKNENGEDERGITAHWLKRTGRDPSSFALGGSYVAAGEDEPEAQFFVPLEGVVYAMVNTFLQTADAVISSLTKAGRIPNPTLATGRQLHADIQLVIDAQVDLG